jgi:nuclear transport factor 2 (NTF2) superfamily protein
MRDLVSTATVPARRARPAPLSRAQRPEQLQRALQLERLVAHRLVMGEWWGRELDYALRKDLWSFHGNRIAVRFQYESHDAAGQWYRSYGNE